MINIELAKNPNTPSEIPDQLANYNSLVVRRFAAKNLNTSSKTLEKLANDVDSYVRYWVEKNPNTPDYLKFYLYFKL